MLEQDLNQVINSASAPVSEDFILLCLVAITIFIILAHNYVLLSQVRMQVVKILTSSTQP